MQNPPKEFLNRVTRLSGQEIRSCYHCGKCTAGCPMVNFMDLNPRQTMKGILDDSEEVLEANAPWICATCYNCSARCPNEIDIAAVMEALRQIQLREGLDEVVPSEISREELVELPQIALISCFRKMTG